MSCSERNSQTVGPFMMLVTVQSRSQFLRGSGHETGDSKAHIISKGSIMIEG